MKQSVSLITLGVADYARATAFYEAMGWSTAMDVEETAFFAANGVVLVLWSRERLADDLGVEDDGARWSGIALAHNVGSDAEVDRVIAAARANGAEISRAPAPTFYGGYAGAFRDPDGHVWEVAHNPGFGLDDDGSVVLPAGRPGASGRAPARLGRLSHQWTGDQAPARHDWRVAPAAGTASATAACRFTRAGDGRPPARRVDSAPRRSLRPP